MESQPCLDSGTQVDPETSSFLDRDPGCALSGVPDHVEQDLQPAKKATRQWAAWTHEEEESFFTALRQVGKNFEKITHRIESKNKEQVRHYYYRLVKRMNKLLDPGLCLDAKNSKDTIAAMLRWWSLLEKYSCKASKLHRRPRRFKLFMEALESQLLKDRKKIIRGKRPPPGESCSTAQSTNTSQNKASGPDARMVNSKADVSDSRNIERSSGKASLKRLANADHCNKGESATIKAARKRQKQGVISPAAYRKWEKAAIAGVSLVADAAEHLERAAMDKCVQSGRVKTDAVNPIQKVVPHLPIVPQNHCVQSDARSNVKLKLQLFPFDDGTRTTLELEKHNPYLELTLAARKKISSVLEHINRKWGNSNMASGELTLLPYACRENLDSCLRWTQKSTASAVDVYNLIGCPPVFRLRYRWFSVSERSENHADASICLPKMVTQQLSLAPISTDVISGITEHADDGCPEDCLVKTDDLAPHIATDKKLSKEKEDSDDVIASSAAVVWVDTMTSISVGDLLSEVPSDVNSDLVERPIITQSEGGQYHDFCSFNCDSFDAAIAAYMSNKDKQNTDSLAVVDRSALWDAEETCDAFLFQSTRMEPQQHASPATAAPPSDDIMQELHHILDDEPKSSTAGVVYWSESVGALLDFDVMATKYHGEEMMVGGDSLGAFSHLLANSCDAFQNPLFCGGQGHDDKDDPSPLMGGGAQEKKM